MIVDKILILHNSGFKKIQHSFPTMKIKILFCQTLKKFYHCFQKKLYCKNKFFYFCNLYFFYTHYNKLHWDLGGKVVGGEQRVNFGNICPHQNKIHSGGPELQYSDNSIIEKNAHVCHYPSLTAHGCCNFFTGLMSLDGKYIRMKARSQKVYVMVFFIRIVNFLFVKMKVFNYSELHFSEVTSYKIHTLAGQKSHPKKSFRQKMFLSCKY